MRRLELDLLRFIAVLLVLGRHMYPCEDGSDTLVVLSRLWQTGGWIGVDLFFVLSGFLVSGLLFREWKSSGAMDAKRFLLRRALKIYPSFWVLIAVSLVYVWCAQKELQLMQLLSELLFIQNYVTPMWNHTWSLAVEEHFYLSLVVLLTWLTGRKRRAQDAFRSLPILFVSVATACLFFRSLTALQDFSAQTHLFASHLRLDSLMFGALLAYYWELRQTLNDPRLGRYRFLLIAAGSCGLLPAFFFPQETTRWISVFGVLLFYLASGAILIGALHCRLPVEGPAATCARLGKFSYSIYLWHMPVHNWLTPALLAVLPGSLGSDWFVYVAVYLSLSFSLGVWAHKLIEAPVLLMRDRFFPARSPADVIRTAERRDSESATQLSAGTQVV